MKIHQHINAIYQAAYSLPEILIAILILGTAIAVWMLDKKELNKILPKTICISLLTIFIIMLVYNTADIQAYTRLFAYNYFSYQLKALLIGFSALFAVFLSAKHISNTMADITSTIWLGLIFSLMLITSANSFIAIYISFELYTVTVCFLISSANRSKAKSSLRFIILSTVMSCIFLYGISLYYTNIGSVSFYSIMESKLNIAGMTGVLFILSYFLFKLNAAPFHIWSMAAYSSMPTQITMFIDSISKFVIFAVFCSFYANLFLAGIVFYREFLLIISILSMIVGGIAPFAQNNIKKFIAYSSVGHIGFALTVFTVLSDVLELKYALTYLFSYFLSSVCFFSGLICINKYTSVTYFSDTKGTIKIYPIYAYSMICGLFSMIGLPPFIGFITKINIFYAVISHDKLYICIIMLIYTIFTIAYTVKALMYMFMKGDIEGEMQTSFLSKAFNIAITMTLVVSNIWFPYIDKQGSQIISSLKTYHQYIKSHEQNRAEMDLTNDGIKQLYEHLKTKSKKPPSLFEKTLDKFLSLHQE